MATNKIYGLYTTIVPSLFDKLLTKLMWLAMIRDSDVGGPFSTVVVGVLSLVLDQVSAARHDRLRNKVSSVKSGMTKKLEKIQDIVLGAILLLVEDHFLGDNHLVSHKFSVTGTPCRQMDPKVVTVPKPLNSQGR